ncbi:MAG: tyrosine protein phosphatase [Deltaproteobacteria bacterium]|nr:tyrosine protein phosphatase [Deltaproteobacteria bacterium]
MYRIQHDIPGTLAIVARPRHGYWLANDIARLKVGGVDVLASLLEPAEAADLGLDLEARACAVAGIEFVSIPVPDHGVPERAQEFLAAAESLRKQVAAGRTVGIHCYASIGRSSLLAATILVLAGDQPEQAWSKAAKARGTSVPETGAQRRWVDSLVPRPCR